MNDVSKKSGEQLRQFVKELPAAVYSCDAQGRINFYNDAAVKLWGRKPEIGKESWCGSWKIFKPNGSPVPLDSCPMAIALKEGCAIMGEEIIIERPDGSRSNVLVYPQAEFGLSDEITGALNMMIDITEQVSVRKKIEESEERFRYLVEQTLSPICIFKGEDMILEVANEPVFKIWNVGKETLGKPFLEIVPEMRDQPFMGLLLDVFRNGVTHYGNEWPAYFVNKDGEKEEYYFNFVFQPYREPDKTISGVFVFANDVTEQVIAKNENLKSQELHKRELEDKVQQRTFELNKANEELIKMNKELKSFTYVSSHDLQEPLRKIQTFTGRILETENQRLTDKGKNYFRLIQDSANHMQTLILDLLAFSHVNATERIFVTTDLKAIIEDVKTELKESIEEKHATIEATELCPVFIIRFQFRQLMQNLIGNALKFSRPKIPPQIIIKSIIESGNKLNNEKLSKEKNYCHITVSDNGIGFEKEYSEKIFEIFQRLHGKEDYAGTGIGLAIVKKIVDNHNGIITATSTLGKGATFDIYIPVD